MKKLCLSVMLLLGITAHAAEDKVQLVDAVLQQSSIEISIKNMPSQLSQLPAMLPLETQQKQLLMEDVVNAISQDFNEIEVLNAVKQYFVLHGDTDKLKATLEWLYSPEGREITQVEILAQQVDPAAMQKHIMSFNPEALAPEKLALFRNLVRVTEVNEIMFKMMDKLVPSMMKALVKIDNGSGQNRLPDAAVFEEQFSRQMTMMRNQFGPMLEMQMVSALSYMFKDASDSSLQAYSEFLQSAAGKHYMALSIDATLEYGIDWMDELMTGLLSVALIEQSE